MVSTRKGNDEKTPRQIFQAGSQTRKEELQEIRQFH